ncbi:hypothetical protein D9M73_258660 [compost metagenome]
MTVSKAVSICRARVSLSMTKPSSVLRLAERGSKLNEPTNTRAWSTAKVLACRLDPELPKGPALGGSGGSPASPRISNNCTPARSKSSRRLA